MTYKENARLRSKRYKLEQGNPNKVYTIKKAVLYDGDVEIDKFNLKIKYFSNPRYLFKITNILVQSKWAA